MMDKIESNEFEVTAIDKIPDGITNAQIDLVRTCDQMKTTGLAYTLKVS